MNVPEQLIWLTVSTIIGLHAWALLGLVRLQIRLTALETQVKRIISDIDSEKGTRNRANERLQSQLDQLKGKQ